MTDARFPALGATALFLFLAGLPPVPRVRADEAMLRDGQKVTGNLVLTGQRRLRFTSGGKALSIGQIERVHLNGRGRPLSAAALKHALFRSGERLTGELLGLDAHALRLRTAWTDEVRIPRHALAGVTHGSDQVMLFHEDFEKKLIAWQLTGTPLRSDRQHVSGRHSLCLNTPGQEAAYALPRPIDAGRADVSFFDPGTVSGVRWLLVAEFAGVNDPARVVLADGGRHYTVEATLAGDEVPPVVRTDGWHSLSLRFAPAYLLIGIDDVVVWSSAKSGPGGPLRRLALRCEAQSEPKAGSHEVYFDDLSLARSADGPAQRTGDEHQDDVWLLAGDQLFGRVTRADHRTVDVETRPGAQTFSWAEVRGIYFRLTEAPRHVSQGEHVRVGVHSCRGYGLDELEGVLEVLDERRLVLRHAELGELTIDRSCVAQVRPLFFGERRELDTGSHHLGPPGQSAAHMRAARAEGPALTCRFHLDTVTAEARLSLRVAHLKGTGDGIGPALERGELRTEVTVNGNTVDYLNRHRTRSSRQLHRISLQLPAECLHAGENTLELRQTPERATGRLEHCMIHGVVLELLPPSGGRQPPD